MIRDREPDQIPKKARPIRGADQMAAFRCCFPEVRYRLGLVKVKGPVECMYDSNVSTARLLSFQLISQVLFFLINPSSFILNPELGVC